MKVSPALAEKWFFEWEKARWSTARSNRGYVSPGTPQERLERFLKVMGPEIAQALKQELLEVLLAETATNQVEVSNGPA